MHNSSTVVHKLTFILSKYLHNPKKSYYFALRIIYEILINQITK